jgi:hypothetical protein
MYNYFTKLISNPIGFKTFFTFVLDHPSHKEYIPPDLWGLDTEKNKKLANFMFRALTDPNPKGWHEKSLSNVNQAQTEFLDQFKFYIDSDILSHDSFFCHLYKGNVRSFPVRRTAEYCLEISGKEYGCCANTNSNDYYNESGVRGLLLASGHKRQCPKSCRPTEHKDWLYC